MNDRQDSTAVALANMIIYNSLARAFNYPDDALAADLSSGKFAQDLSGAVPPAAQETVAGLSAYTGKDREGLLLEIEKDYTRMFFASKPRIAYLFGSVYSDGKLYQDSTFEITRLYYETGLKLNESFKLPPDHIAVELEFMAYLAYNEMEAAEAGHTENENYARELQEKVLNGYLRPLSLNIGKRIAGQAKTAFYRAMGALLLALLTDSR
jgi:putative dimethyl sulfoxide reductase chaperone